MHVRLRVMGPDARPQVINLQASSQTEAIRQVAARGTRVLAVEAIANELPRGRRGGKFPIEQFSQELLALLDAGLNLTQALETLHAKERRDWINRLFETILQSLREGKNFSETLARHPEHFPDVYVATVRAAERTGDLPQALGRYIAYQLQFESLRKKLIAAAIYPAMLLIVGGFVLLFLLGYVVPRFSIVYESAGRELPWLSALLLAIGKFIYTHWTLCGSVIAIIFVVMIALLRQPAARQYLITFVLRVPVLAHKAREFRLARFYRAVGLLLASGIPLTRALTMVSGLLDSEQQRSLIKARAQVESGLSFSVSLVAHGLAAPVAESLVKIGESTGRLADMLERTAAFHDDDFSRWIDVASRLLEPTLMAMIGLVIGAVVVLMYIPIFELAGGMQ